MSNFTKGHFAAVNRRLQGQEAAPHPLGYAQNISKKDATQLIRDPRFIQDLVDFYRERDGREFENMEEAVERFFQDRTWRNMNTVSLGRDYFGSKGMSEQQRQRLGRLQSVYESYPNPWEEGGRGWYGVRQGAAAALLDPINLVGLGLGSVAAKGAARTAQTSIRAAEKAGTTYAGPSATRAGLVGGMKGGALGEAAVSAPITAGFDYGTQLRDIEVGIRDEVDPWQVAASGAIGGVAGGVLGGAFGAAGAAIPMPGAGAQGGSKLRSAIGQGVDEANTAFDASLAREAQEAARQAAQRQAETAIQSRTAELPEVGSAWDRYLDIMDKRVRGSLEEGVPEEGVAKAFAQLESNKLTGIASVDQLAATSAAMKTIRSAPARIQKMEADAAKIEVTNPETALALRQQAASEAAIYERVTQHLQKGEWEQAEALAQTTIPPAAPPAAGAVAPEPTPGAPPAAPSAAASASPQPEPPPAAPAPPGETQAAGAAAPNPQAVARQAEIEASQGRLAEIEEEIAALEQQKADIHDRRFSAETLTEEESRSTFNEMDQALTGLRNLEKEKAEVQSRLTKAQEELAREPVPEQAVAEEPVAATETPTPDEVARAKAKVDEELLLEQIATIEEDANQLLKELKGEPLNSFVKIVSEGREPWVDANARNLDDLVKSLQSLHAGLYDETPSLASLKADYRQWRAANGIKGRGAVPRRQWANEILLDMEASNHVADIIGSNFVADRMTSNAFSIDAMEVLVSVASNMRFPGRGVEYNDRLMRHYRNWVAQNSADLQVEAVLRAGPDSADDLMRAQFGDETVDFLTELAQIARASDPKQHIKFKPKDAIEALNAVKYTLPENFPADRTEKVRIMVNQIVTYAFGRGMTMDHIQLLVTSGVRRAVDPEYAPGYHMGKSVPGMDYGKNGERITRNTLGGVQSILKGSNRHGYMGRLMQGSTVRGEDGTVSRILGADETAASAIDRAYVESGTQRMVRNPYMAAENAKQVADITAALKRIRTKNLGKKAEAAARELREMPRESLTPDQLAFLERLTFDEDGVQLHPSPEEARAIYSEMLGEGLIRGDIDSVRVLNARRTAQEQLTAREGDLRDLQQKMANLSRRIAAATKAGDKAKRNSLVAERTDLKDKIEEALKQSAVAKASVAHAESGRGVVDEIRSMLQAERLRLTQSTQKEKFGAEVIHKLTLDEERMVNRLWGERSALIKKLGEKPPEAVRAQLAAQRSTIEAEIERLAPGFIAQKKAERKRRNALKKLREAEAAKPEGQRRTEQELIDEINASAAQVGEPPLKPKDVDTVRAAEDMEARDAALTATTQAKLQDVVEQWREDGNLDALRAAVEKLLAQKAESKAAAAAPPTTKPIGGYSPMVVVKKGYEVDVRNHFHMVNREDGVYDIMLTVDDVRQNVGTLTRLQDGSFEVMSVAEDGLRMVYGSMPAAQRGFADVFDGILDLHAQQGRFRHANVITNTSHTEPDWRNTNTYKGAPEEAATNPPAAAAGEPDAAIGNLVASYSVPPDRDFAIQFIEGPHKGLVRSVPRTRENFDKMTLGGLLGRAKNEPYVIGTVEVGVSSNSARAQTTFKPLKEGDTYIRPNAEPPTNPSRFADEPDVIQPTERPIPLSKLGEHETKASDIEAIFTEASPEVRESLLGQYGNAQSVFDEILSLENVSWKKLLEPSPHSTALTRFDGFTDHLARLYQLQARLTPHGVKLPNVNRRASMNQLAAIFGETRKDELAAVFNILRQLGGDSDAMPKFRGDPNEGYNYATPRSDVVPGEKNAINVAVSDTAVGQPEFAKTIHEIFHWAYLNILSPEERMVFWRSMRSYVNEGGLAEGDLMARLPGSASNELKSPAEFFANQGSMWALGQGRAGDPGKLAHLWKSIVKTLEQILSRLFGYEKKADRSLESIIDERLVPLFERILPDEILEGKKFESLRTKYSGAKGPLSFYSKKLDEYEQIKAKIHKALLVEDEGLLLEALVPDGSGSPNFVSEAFAVSGKGRHLPRQKDGSYGGRRIYTFDGGEQEGQRALASGQVIDIVNDPNGYHIRGKLLRTMRDIQREVAALRADRKASGMTTESADESDRLAEIELLMRTQDEGDEVGVPIPDWDAIPEGMRAVEGLTTTRSGSEIANLKLLAAQAAQVLEEAQGHLLKRMGRSVPLKEGEGIRFTAGGKQEATKRSPTSQRFARRAIAKKHKQAERDAQTAANVMDNIDTMIGNPPPSAAAGAEGVFSSSLHDMSSEQLIKSLAGQSKRSPEKRAMAAELLQRERAKPEVGKGPFERSPEFEAVDDAALYNSLLTWLERGKPEEVTKRVREITARNFDVNEVFRSRKGNADPLITPKASRVGHALQVEQEQTAGLQQYNGVPPDAPAAIQEALLKLTHRDKTTENVLRTMGYRMMNLMGRTQRDLLGKADFMSVEDVYRMAGMEAPPEVRAAFKEVASLDGPAFNQLRKDLRRFAIGINAGKGDPLDLMHEIGHMIARATFSKEQMQQINASYAEALVKGDRLAAKIADKYGDSNMARSAEEWFVEGWAQYLGERVAKGDIFKVRQGETPLRLKNQLERFIDQLIEFVAYVTNGLIGNNSIRQQYRRLTFYGDMFAGSRAKTPVKTAVGATGSYAIAPSIAARYTREVIDSLPEWKRMRASEFVGADPMEDLSAYVFYHGTPNGRSFRRDTGLNPVLEPSAPDALYGPGVYVINSRGMASNYSNSGHGASVRKMVDSATDNPNLRGEGYVIADMIGQKTAQIAELNFEMTFTGHSALTRKRAAKAAANNQLDELMPDDPVHTMLANERKLERLLNEEKQLWDLLESTVGVPHEPAVLPLFVRAMEPFDFREGASYHFNGGRGDISWLPHWLHQHGYLSDEGVTVLKREREPMSGSDLFELLTENAMLRGNKASDSADAKLKLQAAMRELGYDSYHVTESDFAGLQSYDAMVLFDSHQVKHVDADLYDADRTGIYNSVYGEQMNITSGRVAMDMADTNRNLGPGDVAPILRELDQKGMLPRMREIHRKMLRGQDLDHEDVSVARGYGPMSILRENSGALRRMGAHWFADKMKPEHGPGFFDKHNADLADIVQPLMVALRELDDVPGGPMNWLRRSGFAGRTVGGGAAGAFVGTAILPGPGTLLGSVAGLAGGFVWGKNYRAKQPGSYGRILSAMRQGRDAMDALKNPQERDLAHMIQRMLKEERQRVEEAGLPIGDITQSGRTGTYVPQMWDAESIRAEPSKFRNLMTNWFYRESANSEMGQISMADAREAAERMIQKIVDEDGSVAESGWRPFGSTSSDPFFQRFINLNAEDVPDLEPFMINDLEGILTKYFNRTVRKRSIAKEFGAGGHGYDAYTTISQKGRPGAVEVLTSSKISTGVRGFGQDAIEIETTVVPALRNEQGKVERLINEIDEVLGPTRRTAMENRDKARQLLLSQFDPEDVSADQWNNYKVRVDAVLNGLVDFREHGASSGLQSFMNRYWNVVNQRPIDGGDGTGAIYTTSRALRAFNSVSMLGFATLTSIPDLALPLIRSGNLKAWSQGLKQWATDPSYRNMIRNVGVGVENLLHDRMVGMAGDASQRFTSSFFHLQGLTPWTNMTREIAGLVGFNAFKAEMDIARRLEMLGKTNTTKYRNAVRFLDRYGLSGDGSARQGGIDFSKVDSPRIDDMQEWARNPQLRYALMRFVNEAVFVPDANDVPLWAQGPVGAMIYQLKSFPTMAGRLSWYAMKETMAGNPRPLMYLGTAGAALGATAAGVKDVVQFRGGEDNQQADFRVRQTGSTAIGTALHAFGFPEKDLGPEEQQALAWWFDGLLHLGGLGLLGEIFIDTAANVDDGNYGYNRVISALAGPTYDTGYVGFRAVGGLKAAFGDQEETSTRANMRIGARAVAARTPVLGGVRAYRETVADGVAEPGRKPKGDPSSLAEGGGFKSGGFSGKGFDL